MEQRGRREETRDSHGSGSTREELTIPRPRKHDRGAHLRNELHHPLTLCRRKVLVELEAALVDLWQIVAEQVKEGLCPLL